MFNVNRNWFEIIRMNLITFGIYGLVVTSHISREVNVIATPRDGKHTMHYLLIVFVFSWLTLGIAPLVWRHRISNRIGAELGARGIGYKFGAFDFWLWAVLGSIIIVGPFIYLHKLLTAMNLLNSSALQDEMIVPAKTQQKCLAAMFAERAHEKKSCNIFALFKRHIQNAKHIDIRASIWLNVVELYVIVIFIIDRI